MLKRSKSLSCFILLILGSLYLSGQPRLVFHMDKAFYVTGEVIWFNVYLPPHLKNETLLTLSVYDEQGEELDAFSIYTENGAFIPGYYRIPHAWNSGYYRFVITGSEQSKAEPYELLTVGIPIYNDLKELPKALTVADREPIPNPLSSLKTCEVKFISIPEEVSPGDSLTIQFQVRDMQGKPLEANASVAVTDVELTGREETNGMTIFQGKTFPGEDFILSGTSIIKGALFLTDGTPYITNFFGAFDKAANDFYYDIAYNLNYFTLRLPRLYRNIDVQFLDFQEENLDIQLLGLPGPGPWTGPPLSYPPYVVEYLKRSTQRKKIYKLFQVLETPLAFQIPEVERKPWEPDRRFILNEYESFADLPSLFFEISTPLKFKVKKKGGYEARMFNPEFGSRSFYPEGPLFILDGKLTRNAPFIANLDIGLIDTLDLYYYFNGLKENFGILGYNGVVHIQTQGKGINLPAEDPFYSFQLPGLQIPLNAYKSMPINRGQNHPELKPQQYWNAEVKTDSKGVGKIGFVQGKDISTFGIEILVQAKDGTFGFIKSYYQVVPKSSP